MTKLDEAGSRSVPPQGAPTRFDPLRALDTAELFAFIGATQVEAWNRLLTLYGGDPDKIQRGFTERLAKELDARGTVVVLRPRNRRPRRHHPARVLPAGVGAHAGAARALRQEPPDGDAPTAVPGGLDQDHRRVFVRDKESAHLEYKVSLRTHADSGETFKPLETASLQTIAAFLNSREGGTLLIGVAETAPSTVSTPTTPTAPARSTTTAPDWFQQHLLSTSWSGRSTSPATGAPGNPTSRLPSPPAPVSGGRERGNQKRRPWVLPCRTWRRSVCVS